MNRKKFYNIDEQLLNKIISVAYGDSGFIEKIKIYSLAKKDVEVAEILNEYMSTANAVHELEKNVCPESLLEKVQKITGVKEKKSFGSDLFSILVSRPIITVGATAVIVLMLVKSLVFTTPYYDGYSEAEVIKADREVRASFALIGKVFNKTRTTIKDEVLTTRVGKPLNEGINFVNNLFIEEK
ncbi:MAG: hypothetical protein JEY94_06400 [Melioribacteraceae bacterium]|nr:hypothetical protein [Melioribacteraceae bacterium]